MRIAWDRIGAVLLNLGVWAILLAGGRHALHLVRGEALVLARLAMGRGLLA
jgi:hypothetical protein